MESPFLTLNTDDLEFDYHTENSERFTKDFLNYVVTDAPLFALQDEFLYLMSRRKLTHFRIPGYKCVDGQDHYFYFKLRHIEENPNIKVYTYLGIDLEKRGLLKRSD
ncbi:DUF5960 family protein [Enterococcus sp. AZ007]|uniref:DUF5960 family protein n=1 Tax=Enterococcus sp. AZ007 TaxID=2774839 RepID=UPI003F694D87